MPHLIIPFHTLPIHSIFRLNFTPKCGSYDMMKITPESLPNCKFDLPANFRYVEGPYEGTVGHIDEGDEKKPKMVILVTPH
jgi:hypothetical protein